MEQQIGKMTLSILQSVDGYIADNNHQFDMLEGFGGTTLTDIYTGDSPFDFDNFLNNNDCIVMGHTAYVLGMSDSFVEEQVYIVTDKDYHNEGNLHFVKPNRIVKLMLAKRRQDKQIYIFGGGLTAHLFLEGQAFDELLIATVPYILGSGRSLFYPQENPIPLQLESVDIMGGLTLQRYSLR